MGNAVVCVICQPEFRRLLDERAEAARLAELAERDARLRVLRAENEARQRARQAEVAQSHQRLEQAMQAARAARALWFLIAISCIVVVTLAYLTASRNHESLTGRIIIMVLAYLTLLYAVTRGAGVGGALREVPRTVELGEVRLKYESELNSGVLAILGLGGVAMVALMCGAASSHGPGMSQDYSSMAGGSVLASWLGLLYLLGVLRYYSDQRQREGPALGRAFPLGRARSSGPG